MRVPVYVTREIIDTMEIQWFVQRVHAQGGRGASARARRFRCCQGRARSGWSSEAVKCVVRRAWQGGVEGAKVRGRERCWAECRVVFFGRTSSRSLRGQKVG